MNEAPFFSIVITTFRRPRQIVECLHSLEFLDYPRSRYEVIVVDDGSPEPLDAIISSFRASLPLTLLRQPNGGPASGRNTGARHARGRYLAFTDDDCQPAPDWLKRLEACLLADPDIMVGGRTVNVLPSHCSAASQIIHDLVYGFFNHDPEHARFFATNNMALPRLQFLAAGGLDESFRFASEDRELCDRWHHLGFRLRYEPAAQTDRSSVPTPLRAGSDCLSPPRFELSPVLPPALRLRPGRGPFPCGPPGAPVQQPARTEHLSSAPRLVAYCSGPARGGHNRWPRPVWAPAHMAVRQCSRLLLREIGHEASRDRVVTTR